MTEAQSIPSRPHSPETPDTTTARSRAQGFAPPVGPLRRSPVPSAAPSRPQPARDVTPAPGRAVPSAASSSSSRQLRARPPRPVRRQARARAVNSAPAAPSRPPELGSPLLWTGDSMGSFPESDSGGS